MQQSTCVQREEVIDATGTYLDALNWLLHFTDTEGVPPSLEAMSLERPAALLDILNHPHESYPTIVIAGTKGKGSTAAMVESMLRAAGLRTGLYTTPHMHSFRERMRVNGEPITEESFVALTEVMKQAVEELPPSLGTPSTYEVATPMAFLHFAAEAVDVAVLEVGLGGATDAVNVVEPTLTAITSISYDHTQILGDRLTDIVHQKAGILRRGVPVITVSQVAEAAMTIHDEAEQCGAPLYHAEPDGIHAPDAILPYLAPITPETASEMVNLRGLFQQENSRLASGIVQLWYEWWQQQQPTTLPVLPLTADTIRHGLAQVEWPGRFEVVDVPSPPHPAIVLDGAHNGDSAAKLMRSLQAEYPDTRLILVLSILADKDIPAIAEELLPYAAMVVLTTTAHARSASLEHLATTVWPYVQGRIQLCPDPPTAIETALTAAAPHDLVCVTGSLSVVAAAREYLAAYLGQRHQKQTAP